MQHKGITCINDRQLAHHYTCRSLDHTFINFPFSDYKFSQKFVNHVMSGLTVRRWEQKKVTKIILSQRSAITLAQSDKQLLCGLLLFNNFFCRERVLYYGLTILKFSRIETFHRFTQVLFFLFSFNIFFGG